ncbi:CooT family nickel-binding protein [Parasporobacterium paucivorans]|uniref:Predicted RNA-binding protein n=1 Tax=Parasporobacterium paucivorans DSM 15970 TaxID=1122934 RepID=A0A1M6A9L5_9FIRM|nr:CooT family nickel-binding protein [Parasporobacterium paucivorans]SHI33165.1 Predicted RNA-binding protein [Parasporobacterium paucivorans DSM 15970]
MCLIIAYKKFRSPENVIAEYINKARVEGNEVILTDIMNQDYSVKGKLSSFNLEKNELIIDSDE